MASSEIGRISKPSISGHSAAASSSGGKKSCFVGWLDKIFKRDTSRNGTKNRRRPQLLREESMAGRAPHRALDDRTRSENEELDRAVAVSLREDLQKPNGFRRQTDSDEDLARALQDYWNSPSYTSGEFRYCASCKKPLDHGGYLACMGAFWHPDCFCCHACGFPITENEFSLSGKNKYHNGCFRELHHPKCEVCHQFIPMNGAGLIEYRSHPFWGQKYCPAHEHDGTARCCSCEKLESRTARYVSLGDGRSLCLECCESAVMDTGECQPLYHAIRDFYEGMNMRIDQQIPLLLVERQALNEAIEGEKNGYHHLPETRGLCLSEEQTVTSIFRRPRFGGNRLMGMRTHRQKLARKCDVTAILVLYGLPRLLTGSILAHELMHAWLRLKGYRNLSPMVEEGICQVLSHMWLESEVIPRVPSVPSTSRASSSSSSLPSSSLPSKKGGVSEREKMLGKFFIHQIDSDTSTSYGEGFKKANEATKKYGLRGTLEHIRLTGTCPL